MRWINLFCKVISWLEHVRAHAVIACCRRKGICLCQFCTKLDCERRVDEFDENIDDALKTLTAEKE